MQRLIFRRLIDWKASRFHHNIIFDKTISWAQDYFESKLWTSVFKSCRKEVDWIQFRGNFILSCLWRPIWEIQSVIWVSFEGSLRQNRLNSNSFRCFFASDGPELGNILKVFGFETLQLVDLAMIDSLLPRLMKKMRFLYFIFVRDECFSLVGCLSK